MSETEFKIDEPNIPAANHSVHNWVMKVCVCSSIAFLFGNSVASDTVYGSNIYQDVCIPVCDNWHIAIPESLVTELNRNAEIKERLISRLSEFKSNLKYGWNGGTELPMEEMSISNALAAIDATASEELVKWTVFPSPNGTILFSPTDDFVAGISIGNNEFSYAALGNKGQEIKGKEIFSVKSFKLAISLINSLNEV